MKYACGSLALARKRKLNRELCFLTELKDLVSNGFLPIGTLSSLNEDLFMSTATINRRIRKCVDAGWMRRIQSGYEIASYDAIWKSLGFDVKWNVRDGRWRRGTFPIIKIEDASENAMTMAELELLKRHDSYNTREALTASAVGSKCSFGPQVEVVSDDFSVSINPMNGLQLLSALETIKKSAYRMTLSQTRELLGYKSKHAASQRLTNIQIDTSRVEINCFNKHVLSLLCRQANLLDAKIQWDKSSLTATYLMPRKLWN